MWYALIDKSLTNIAMCRSLRWSAVTYLGLLELTVTAISKQIVWVARAHNARTGKSKRNSRSIDRDPSTTPLFGNIGSSARAASGIKNEIARIGGHQNTSFNNLSDRLNDVKLVIAEASGARILPDSVIGLNGKSSTYRMKLNRIANSISLSATSKRFSPTGRAASARPGENVVPLKVKC